MRKTGSCPERWAFCFRAVAVTVGLMLGPALWATSVAAADVVPMPACADCHPKIYASYTNHGMSRSLGKVTPLPTGRVTNHKTGWRYEIVRQGAHAILRANGPDGGVRTQKVVGQIGAGIFDVSWATAELHPISGEPVNRLFFAPVENVTGHGLELSPFEHSQNPSGVDMALTSECLGCHTDTVVHDLPAASSQGAWVAPGHALGVNAFDHLQPLGCGSCHGNPRGHLQLMNGDQSGGIPDLKVLSDLSPARQRDICARCHLQGDVRFQMVPGRPALDRPLAAQFPTLVTTEASDDFRFVGQLERLSLSDCFKSTAAMTCTTCHDPHTSVKAQGVASFERACIACHQANSKATASCSRPSNLQVASVTGSPARSKQGCIDCHLRRSQPFDLPGIRTTDHFIRARIGRPQAVPYRAVTKPGGAMKVWDDGRLTKMLATKAGRRWRDGVLAMGMMQTGRFAEAMALFDRFPAPGTAAAIRPTAPTPLISVETWPTFHQLRGMALLVAKRAQAAQAAFGDALRLAPTHPGALMGRARIAALMGNVQQAMLDTQRFIEAFPASEAPWQLRTLMAQRLQRPDFQVAGLEAVVKRWPSDVRAWLQLARLYAARGDAVKANHATSVVRRLQPSLLATPP